MMETFSTAHELQQNTHYLLNVAEFFAEFYSRGSNVKAAM